MSKLNTLKGYSKDTFNISKLHNYLTLKLQPYLEFKSYYINKYFSFSQIMSVIKLKRYNGNLDGVKKIINTNCFNNTSSENKDAIISELLGTFWVIDVDLDWGLSLYKSISPDNLQLKYKFYKYTVKPKFKCRNLRDFIAKDLFNMVENPVIDNKIKKSILRGLCNIYTLKKDQQQWILDDSFVKASNDLTISYTIMFGIDKRRNDKISIQCNPGVFSSYLRNIVGYRKNKRLSSSVEVKLTKGFIKNRKAYVEFLKTLANPPEKEVSEPFHKGLVNLH